MDDSINSEENSSFDHTEQTSTKRLSQELNLDNSTNQTFENGNDQHHSNDDQSPQSQSDHEQIPSLPHNQPNEYENQNPLTDSHTNEDITSTIQQPSSPLNTQQNQFTESPSIEETNNIAQQESSPPFIQSDNNDQDSFQLNQSPSEQINNSNNQDQNNFIKETQESRLDYFSYLFSIKLI